MSVLSGLTGTKKTFTLKVFSRSVPDLMKYLKRDGFSTAANKNGAINVWKDNKGIFRAEHYIYCRTENSVQTDSLKVLRDWLKIYYPQIL